MTRGYTSVSAPHLSPDGKRYVTRWLHPTQEDVAIINNDGSNLRALTDDKYVNRRPRWFPDGERIAFSSDRSGVNQIWTINADGTGLRQLTFAADNGADWATLSADGKRLAYSQLKNNGGLVFVLDLTRDGRSSSPNRLRSLRI